MRRALARPVYRVASALPPELLRRLGRTRVGLRFGSLLGPGGAIRVRGGHLAGLWIDEGGTTPGYALGTSQPGVQQALVRELRPGAVFYDVGANVGFFTLLAARLVGSSGQVIAFEPVAKAVSLLRANVARNDFENVTVVEKAVADREGRATMRISNDLLVSSLEHGEREGPTVDLTTIDSLVSGGLPPPDVVKVDVEGAEAAVLRGMRETLSRHRPGLVVELHGENAEEEILDVLREAGYGWERLERDEGGMQHLWCAPGAG